MDIAKARRLIELSKEDKKVVVTLWEGGRISSCALDGPRQWCETCEGDEQLLTEWVDHLREKGYEATEVQIAELEDSLPRFMEEREMRVRPTVVVEEEQHE